MKAVILAGGTGTRLWPLSRDLKPKQFHSFVGTQTMLQQTYDRLSFLPKRDIFISTNSQYQSIVEKQIKDIAEDRLIIEPAMRDTAPCICYAAHRLTELGYGNEVMAIVYADHLIQNPSEFEKALLLGEAHIKATNKLGVIGVRAKYPNPNLGYIRTGELKETMENGFEIYELGKFVEKPTLATAKKFLNSYKYLWNTGLYMWKVSAILEKFKTYAPEIYEATKTAETYGSSPKISIDYAIIERIKPREMRVIPAELDWNDIGNWAALHEELTHKEKENISSGDALTIDTEGSVVMGASGKLVVTYGVKNLVVVDTEEALLIMSKDKASDVKKLIDEIKKQKKEKFL
jgi:mannose-1-phosphate guanylyltransferase